MKRLIVGVLLFASLAFAQRGVYGYEKKHSLSTSAAVVTLQVPAAAALRYAEIDSATITCSAQCELTVERNGTAATTTAAAGKAYSGASTALALIYYDSNAGTGDVLARYILQSTWPPTVIPLSDLWLHPGENATIRTTSMSGTVVISLKWREIK